MGGERMAESMRRNRLAQGRFLHPFGDLEAGPPVRETSPAEIEEQGMLLISLSALQIETNGPQRRLPHRHEAFAAAFAEDAHHAGPKVDIFDVQPAGFLNSQPRRIKKL